MAIHTNNKHVKNMCVSICNNTATIKLNNSNISKYEIYLHVNHSWKPYLGHNQC